MKLAYDRFYSVIVLKFYVHYIVSFCLPAVHC